MGGLSYPNPLKDPKNGAPQNDPSTIWDYREFYVLDSLGGLGIRGRQLTGAVGEKPERLASMPCP